MILSLAALSREDASLQEAYGQKAAWLARAIAAGFAVPEGFALTAEQAQRLAGSEQVMHDALSAALAMLAPDVTTVAVRSSPRESLPGALLTLYVARDVASVLSAVREVLASNDGPSARAQRRARKLSHEAPALSVIVQHFVEPSAPGDMGAVVFTHDPDHGTQGPLGEFQPALGAQHVVSGKRISLRIAPRDTSGSRAEPPASTSDRVELDQSLSTRDPMFFSELEQLARALVRTFDEPLELELVRSGGTPWLLQVRPLVLSARALVKLALDAIDEDSPRFRSYAERLLQTDLSGLIEREFAPFGPGSAAHCARGLAASPGTGSGVMMLDPERAIARARHEPVVLFRSHATPEDVAAVRVAQALVTTSGGLTCHAAVIARGLGVPAVVGCGELRIDVARGLVQLRNEPDGVLFKEGDPVSVDAHSGIVYAGRRAMVARIIAPEVRRLALELRKLRPHPLWAFGAPEPSLQAKEEMSLDGILCPVSSVEELSGLPRGRGRECWLVIPADRVLELIGLVPGGWGIVVRGELDQIPFESLRARARLTPLGVYLDTTPERTQVPIALDLAVAGADVGQPEHLSGLAPRLLLWADSTLDSARLSHARGIGVLCETERSSEWVLRLALQRPVPTSAH